MQRVTITLENDLLEQVDQFAAARGYANRSEAVRDLARNALMQASEEKHEGKNCVAALVYVYDPESRELARRLTHDFHAHHDLTVATLHVHLDHDSCMEIAVLRGKAGEVRQLGEHVIAERGVVHGRVVTIPVEMKTEQHAHAGEPSHSHSHTRVRGR